MNTNWVQKNKIGQVNVEGYLWRVITTYGCHDDAR